MAPRDYQTSIFIDVFLQTCDCPIHSRVHSNNSTFSHNMYTIASVALIAPKMAGFPRNCSSLLYLLLFASMLTASYSVLSVAPDDFASECTPYAKPGSFNNPNQKVLLDTQFYPSTTLLSATGDDGLWLSLDFDMTTGAGVDKVRSMKISMCTAKLTGVRNFETCLCTRQLTSLVHYREAHFCAQPCAQKCISM